MSEDVLYKFLNGREATHIPGFRYRLGSWKEVTGPLVPCKNGLHLLRVENLSRWIARDLFVAEYDGEFVEAEDKLVVRRARIVEHLTGWNERTRALAACDFAESVLPIWEAHFPNDERPRKAIQAGRDRANGRISAAEAAWAAWTAWAAWAAEREAQGQVILDYAYGRRS